MKSLSTIHTLVAAALLLLGSSTTAPAITVLGWNGSPFEMRYISGRLTHVDQDRHSFTLEWKGPVPTKMEYFQLSFEQTYRVADGTVYKNGSWADMKNGAHVRITGHSNVADSLEFIASTGAQKNATVLDQQGLAKQSLGDWGGALADYNQAIRLDPNYSAAYDNRGNVKRQKGDLNGAMADINQAIRLNLKNATAYFNRAKVKEKKGDLDGAIADFNQAISLKPTYSAAYRDRGEVKRKKGDISGANADFNQALKLGAKS
jgi:tetratricopeptide (TPR) repeat protein